MPAPTMVERIGSPVSPERTSSIRKLTRILRPTKMRRAATQPASFSIPSANVERHTPPSSPSLYSLSSEGDSGSKLLSETDHPLLSPTSSTFSSSASEGHGDELLLGSADKHPVHYPLPDLDSIRAVPVSLTDPSPESQRPLSADYTWAVHKARGVRPQRIIIADKLGRSIDNNTPSPSLRTAEKWGERAKLQPPSPSQWIGSNVRAKTVLGGLSPSALESASGSVLTTSSASSSPATPRPRPVSEINHTSPKPGVDLGMPSQRITELQESELLTETRRRPRSASEPRSFLGSAIQMSQHAGTAPTTPTGYILSVPPELDSGPKSSQTILPPSRHYSPPAMPDDVYFTAAGRRESRMYISPDAAPNYVPPAPMRRAHAHSNSEPVLLPVELDQGAPASRPTTWKGRKEPTSGRPFEDRTREETREETRADGDSTPVSRKEDMWSGTWNREDIQDVIRELRVLK